MDSLKCRYITNIISHISQQLKLTAECNISSVKPTEHVKHVKRNGPVQRSIRGL
jgi:hypothetical protein